MDNHFLLSLAVRFLFEFSSAITEILPLLSAFSLVACFTKCVNGHIPLLPNLSHPPPSFFFNSIAEGEVFLFPI